MLFYRKTQNHLHGRPVKHLSDILIVESGIIEQPISVENVFL